MKDGGSGDFVADLVVPLSTGTLGEFMRLPSEDQELWAAWGHRLFGSVIDPADAKRATAEICECHVDGALPPRRTPRVPRRAASPAGAVADCGRGDAAVRSAGADLLP